MLRIGSWVMTKQMWANKLQLAGPTVILMLAQAPLFSCWRPESSPVAPDRALICSVDNGFVNKNHLFAFFRGRVVIFTTPDRSTLFSQTWKPAVRLLPVSLLPISHVLSPATDQQHTCHSVNAFSEESKKTRETAR